MPFFADDAQNTSDASQMRRAGKPTVTTKRGALSTMARLADQEARHKNVLRPTGSSSYDPKTREMRRLSAVVERLALEQRESLKAESAAADVFSAVSDRVAVIEKAFGDLADAVSAELETARLERKQWGAELESARRVVGECDARTSACVERCDALEKTFDDHEAARLEARLQSLRDVAQSADAALQAQVDAIRDAVASDGSGDARVTTRDILMAGAASEADVVALRDWTQRVTSAHAERLARVEATVGTRGGKTRSAETRRDAKKSVAATPTSRRLDDKSSEGSA